MIGVTGTRERKKKTVPEKRRCTGTCSGQDLRPHGNTVRSSASASATDTIRSPAGAVSLATTRSNPADSTFAFWKDAKKGGQASHSTRQ